MPTEIHCSACDALISPGNQFCPGCGLQLTAQAVPAVYSDRRFPAWYIALVVLLIFFSILYVVGRVDEQHQAKIDAARAAASAAKFHSRAAALEAIASPKAFQAKCGRAFRIEKNSPDLVPGTILLDYLAAAPRAVQAEDRGLIKFSFGPTLRAASETYRGEPQFFTDTDDSPGVYAALERIGCRLPQ